jgi:lipopolysaccharide/colanic/teichoic acid biosynthesis glycosyltransferase
MRLLSMPAQVRELLALRRLNVGRSDSCRHSPFPRPAHIGEHAVRLGRVAAPRSVPAWKRVLDVTVALPLAVLTLPILVVAAVGIKATSRGPIVFWQRRVGRGGTEFWFPKLRSMVVGADDLRPALLAFNFHGDNVTFKMKNDPRVTRVGWLLRTLSIDELPQLWCVITGDMSLVGPRPPLPSEVARYTPTERCRLDVAPGITGLWQVMGRSTIPFDRQVHLDLQYVDEHGPVLDLKILLQTVRVVLSCKGAW